MPTDATRRALHLLSLLQTHRLWRATELAARLETTERTVRRDVDRLRTLGYPIDATTGKYGGYRLAVGAHLPPLILDDDEAVAVAVALRQVTQAPIDGIEDTSLRALLKIEQLLPSRLRHRVSALHSAVTTLNDPGDEELIDSEMLQTLASACRDGEELRFGYRRRDGDESRRHVQPHQLVAADRQWYLVAWDLEREDWRTFRLDRLSSPRPIGVRFVARALPGGDGATFVAHSFAALHHPEDSPDFHGAQPTPASHFVRRLAAPNEEEPQ